MADLKIFAKTVEQEAIDQVNLLLSQDAFKDCKVRIMPDTHAGKGCVIGFTADLGDKVIPNIVGVDIGCGMRTVYLGQIDLDLHKVDDVIRAFVPSGKNVHEGRIVKFPKLQELRCYRELKDTKRLERSIGTLGGGNHFIEVDIDNDNNRYLIIHTGSRNLGKQVADLYQDLAFEIMKGKDKFLEEQEQLINEYKEQGRRSEIQEAIKQLKINYKESEINIPKELCYLSGKFREDYLHDMRICQEFAVINRETIVNIILNKLGLQAIESFETIHNYIDLESNIVRKGAISAKQDEPLLIPINMRDGCIFGRGKGNQDWNCSAPHGAGRLMSRTKAREMLNLEDYQNSMNGIYTTSVNNETIDEAPMAYKSMDEILECIKDTVIVDRILKPIYNYKASE
jgi:tRNA-splicing ligase RtcB